MAPLPHCGLGLGSYVFTNTSLGDFYLLIFFMVKQLATDLPFTTFEHIKFYMKPKQWNYKAFDGWKTYILPAWKSVHMF